MTLLGPSPWDQQTADKALRQHLNHQALVGNLIPPQPQHYTFLRKIFNTDKLNRFGDSGSVGLSIMSSCSSQGKTSLLTSTCFGLFRSFLFYVDLVFSPPLPPSLFFFSSVNHVYKLNVFFPIIYTNKFVQYLLLNCNCQNMLTHFK